MNLGCGPTKIKGFTNIDADKDHKPDLVLVLGKDPFPFNDSTVEEVWCNHTLEHIEKVKHEHIILEIHRVCKMGSLVYLTFPDFAKCSENWITNHKGDRVFWEKTIFGRGMSKWDRHVCLIDRDQFAATLTTFGFEIIYCGIECEMEPYNSLIVAKKAQEIITREEVLRREIFDAR